MGLMIPLYGEIVKMLLRKLSYMCHYRVFIKEVVNSFCEKGAILFFSTTLVITSEAWQSHWRHEIAEPVPKRKRGISLLATTEGERLPRTFQVLAMTKREALAMIGRGRWLAMTMGCAQ